MADPRVAEALPGIEVLLLGGEALPDSLRSEIEASLPASLINVYGPTETTIWSTATVTNI